MAGETYAQLELGTNSINLDDYGITPIKIGEQNIGNAPDSEYLGFAVYAVNPNGDDLLLTDYSNAGLATPGPFNGFNVTVTSASNQTPQSIEVTVPMDFDESLYGMPCYIKCRYHDRTRINFGLVSYTMDRMREFFVFFRVYEELATDAPPVAPSVFNITAEGASFSCPNPLPGNYVIYQPEVYDSVAEIWRSAGPDCIGGEVITVTGLREETGGYKVRFTGILSSNFAQAPIHGAESATFTTISDPGPTYCGEYPCGKVISEEYRSMLKQSPTTRALLIKLTRPDGEVFAYTTHVRDIDGSDITEGGDPVPELDGVLFKASGGVSPTGIASGITLERSDNMEIETILNDESITREDINAGLFNGSQMLVCEVNYKDLTQGIMRHKKGYLGEIKYDTNRFKGELVSLSQKLTAPIIEVTSTLCRAKQFGDDRCKMNLDGQTVDGYNIKSTGTVTVVDSDDPRRVCTIPEADAVPDGYYNYGRLKVTSSGSPNFGATRKIRSHVGGVIGLSEMFPFPIEVGDEVELVIGCDRRIETCSQRMSNAVNFQGEPYIPGVAIYDVVR